jgi:hypothetical protein
LNPNLPFPSEASKTKSAKCSRDLSMPAIGGRRSDEINSSAYRVRAVQGRTRTSKNFNL